MMQIHRLRALAATLLVAVAVPAIAHHSFVAQYDPAKPATRTGTVTKVEWTNPHARFYMDVAGADGKAGNWHVELGSPNTLLRYAWKRDTLKVGDEVTVEGFLARDGSDLINAKTVKFKDGRAINAGSSADLTDTR
jgi:hypothetical protein